MINGSMIISEQISGLRSHLVIVQMDQFTSFSMLENARRFISLAILRVLLR
jgi:hypothetical protein